MLCKEALIRLEKDLQRQIEDSSNEKQQQIVDDMQSLKSKPESVINIKEH